jgi:Flp pilus assembly protein CpaB
MKLAVLVLIVLGLVAAGAVVVLVQAMAFTRDGAKDVPTVDVLVAQMDLPVRTRITGDHVVVKKIPKAGLPTGYFVDPSQAIGKILKLAIARDQPLADSDFVLKTSVDDLLRPGMLAFQIPLARSTTAVDLLYPGCTVDVFATFSLYDRQKGDAVVTPLLQNIRVLGVRDETVVTAADEKTGRLMGSGSHSSGGTVTVTLEVNSRQAAALQLALQRGQLGIAMRSPLDKNWNPMEPMVVKEGQLTAASEALDPGTLALFGRIQQMLADNEPSTSAAPAAVDPNAPAEPNAVAKPAPAPVAPAPPLPPYVAAAVQQQKHARTVTVIRGTKVEETEVSLEQKEPNEVGSEKQGDRQ